MDEAAAARYSLRSSRAVSKTLKYYSDADVSYGRDTEVDENEFFISDTENTEQDSVEQRTEKQGILCIRCKQTYANEISKQPEAHVWRTSWYNIRWMYYFE